MNLVRSATVSAIAVLVGVAGPSAQAPLEVAPREVEEGRAVAVTWNAPGATQVTVAGYGRGPATGTMTITPRDDLRILVIADFAGRSIVTHIDVTVVGGRGDQKDFAADTGLFRYPTDFTFPGELGPAIEKVKSILNTRFGFITKPIYYSDFRIDLQTNHWQVPELQRGLKPQYIARRASHIFQIQRTGNSGIRVDMRSYIEAKRLRDSNWNPDPDDTLYASYTPTLVGALQKGLAQ